MTETIFPDGMVVSMPRQGAPEFVKCRIDIKVSDLIPFLERHANERGWVNLDMLKSQKGGLYLKLNTWKPNGENRPQKAETKDEIDTVRYDDEEQINPDDIPF